MRARLSTLARNIWHTDKEVIKRFCLSTQQRRDTETQLVFFRFTESTAGSTFFWKALNTCARTSSSCGEHTTMSEPGRDVGRVLVGGGDLSTTPMASGVVLKSFSISAEN